MRHATALELIDKRGLPAAVDSERLILGAIVVDGRERMEQLRHSLDSGCFSLSHYRQIWNTMTTLFDAGEGLDRVRLSQALSEAGKLEAVGGVAAIVALDEGMPGGLALDSHVRLLHEKATLRRAAELFHAGLLRVLEDESSADVLAFAQRTLDRIATEAPSASSLTSIEEIIESAGMDFLEPTHDRDGVTLPREWPSLRLICPAFRPGHLVIVAARTSSGKSAWALHLAASSAREGIPVAIITMEMSRREWAERAACHLASVDSYRHQNHTMSPEERRSFTAATQRLRELPLFFDDRAGVTVPSVHAAIQRMRTKPRLVIVDYLQLMSSAGRHDRRAAEVSEISRGLKRMATSLGVPVVALSQFSRESAKADREPELHDLKESGDIENDANVAVFIHPQGTNDRAFQPVSVIVKKHRGGRIGSAKMTFQKPFSRFIETDVL